MIGRTLLFSTLSIFGACKAAPNGAPGERSVGPVYVVYRGNQCEATESRMEVIRDETVWRRWREQQERASLPLSEQEAGEPDALDFSSFIVVAIAMGQEPTSGYSLDLSEDDALLTDGTLSITTTWQQPPEGAVLPQVVTSPCIAITVPRGEYDVIDIRDQQARIVMAQRFGQ